MCALPSSHSVVCAGGEGVRPLPPSCSAVCDPAIVTLRCLCAPARRHALSCAVLPSSRSEVCPLASSLSCSCCTLCVERKGLQVLLQGEMKILSLLCLRSTTSLMYLLSISQRLNLEWVTTFLFLSRSTRSRPTLLTWPKSQLIGCLLKSLRLGSQSKLSRYQISP